MTSEGSSRTLLKRQEGEGRTGWTCGVKSPLHLRHRVASFGGSPFLPLSTHDHPSDRPLLFVVQLPPPRPGHVTQPRPTYSSHGRVPHHVYCRVASQTLGFVSRPKGGAVPPFSALDPSDLREPPYWFIYLYNSCYFRSKERPFLQCLCLFPSFVLDGDVTT